MSDKRTSAGLMFFILGSMVSLAALAAVIPNPPPEVNTAKTTAIPKKKVTCLPVPVKYRHISQISPLDIHRLPRKKILGDNAMMPYPELKENGVECTTGFVDPDVQIRVPIMEDHWKTRIIIGCTMAAAVEVVIVILIVLYWKQIRWTLRKIPCPCDESHRQQRNASEDQGDENGNTNENQQESHDTDLSMSMAPSTSQGHHGQVFSAPRLHTLDLYADQSENSDVEEVIEQVKMPSHCHGGTIQELQSFLPKRVKNIRKSAHRAGSQESDDSEDIASTRPHRVTVSVEPTRVFDCSKSIGGKSFDSEDYHCQCHSSTGDGDSHATKVCKLCANSHSEIESETKSLLSNQSYRTGKLWADGRHLDNPSLSNYVDFGSMDSASVQSAHSAPSANPSVRSSHSKYTVDQAIEPMQEGSEKDDTVLETCSQNRTPISSNNVVGACGSSVGELKTEECHIDSQGKDEELCKNSEGREPNQTDIDREVTISNCCSVTNEGEPDRACHSQGNHSIDTSQLTSIDTSEQAGKVDHEVL